jgi:hypothetical protein
LLCEGVQDALLLVVWGIGFAFDRLVEVAEVGKAVFVVLFVSNFDDVSPVNVATLYWWRRGLSKRVVIEFAALLNGINCLE